MGFVSTGKMADEDGDGEPDQLENIDVFFRGTTEEKIVAKWIPRGVLVDLEPGTMDVIKESPIGPVFRPDIWSSETTARETTGPRGTTQKGRSWSSQCWTESDKKWNRLTPPRDSRSSTLLVVEPGPAW